jgi:serine protein kinase
MVSTRSDLVGNLSQAAKEKFEARGTVLSFPAYLAEVEKNPAKHLRHAAQYFADLVTHFGHYTVERPMGEISRLKLFDAPFDQGENQVLGQERVQNEILRNIQNFVRAGKSDRLILLHGPNGSAKTSLVRMLARAAEVYSEHDEGAIYRFNWVFPVKVAGKAGFGFSTSEQTHSDSYAHLPEEQIEAKIVCDINDHPILLLDAQFRMDWLKQLIEQRKLTKDYPIADFYKRGDLSHRNKKIFQALLTSYRGDISEVFKHIQVERFYFSQRYRVGLASVEPQMSVDAQVRQLTIDQSLASLPSSLKYLSLYETSGALPEGNRGMIEYNDLLKRPIEAWKYLLVATELSQASVGNVSLFFDALMLGSSNELHLQGFREYPDWQSFKGRIELVRVPYLLRYSDELQIYKTQIPRALHQVHIAPLALEVAARWAVLTRLEASRIDRFPEGVRDLIMSLSPAEKLELYDSGATPERLTQKEAKELRQLISQLYGEFDDDLEYEGKYGASPREMRTLILSASQDKRYDHLSPIAILEGIRNLVREKSSYEFLRREPHRGYRDAENFIDVVEKRYLVDLSESIRISIGLIDTDSHKNMLERYIRNVSAWIKREKLYHPATQKMMDPDADLMVEVEKVLMARSEGVEDFRRSLISQIASQKLENPEQEIDYVLLFNPYLKKLKDDYYQQQRRVIEQAQNAFLVLLDGGENQLAAKDKEIAQTLRKNLHEMGYNDTSARNAMAYLLKNR